MNNIKIEDIPLRIGYPYIFRHIDSCDHVIILNDIRVMDKYDNFREKDEKAIVTYQKKLKRKNILCLRRNPRRNAFIFFLRKSFLR
jgi:hypothetical protein